MPSNSNDNDNTQSFVPLVKDTKIGPYKIIKKIGAGGMGEVYLAEDTKLNNKVALKFLPAHLCEEEDCRLRFKREARAAAKLDHANIVTIHELGEYHKRPFFAMQYIDGQTLDEFVKNREIDLTDIINYAIQICSGLREAHEMGIIHRDIKPSNILISKRGRARLVDFGLAAIHGKEKLTRTGSALGTIGYMSPEQAKGKDVDLRSDLFSIGVLLYEMIAGKRPFEGDGEAAILHSIINSNPEPLARYKTDVPDELQRIVSKLLEKSPNLRYQTAAGVISDLEKLIQTESKIIEPTRLINRKNKYIAVGTVLIIIILFFVIKPWRTFQIPLEKHLVVLPFKNIDSTKLDQALIDGLLETITSKITQLNQSQRSLWVVPASEVLELEISGVSKARKTFDINLAITGSAQSFDNNVRLILNLVDAKTERQLQSRIIDNKLSDISAIQDSVVLEVASMLEIQLQPDQWKFLAMGGTTMPEAFNIYLRGRGYLQKFEKLSNIDSAIELFQKAFKMDPHFALAYAGLGEAYWRKYKTVTDPHWGELARHYSVLAVEENNQLAPVYITLGLIDQESGEYERAVNHFKSALNLDPVNYPALRELAETYEALNMYDSAESTYKRAIDVKPNYGAPYIYLGLFYVYQGRQDEALIQMQKAEQAEFKDYQDLCNMGILYINLGMEDEAQKMWDSSISIEPTYLALTNLGLLLKNQQNYIGTAKKLEEALELDDYDYRVWLNLASALYEIPNQREKALATYQKVALMAEEQRKINPRDTETLELLADCYSKLGEKKRAFELIDDALSMAPTNMDILITAGTIYELAGQRDSAMTLVLKGIENGYTLDLLESIPELQELLRDPRFINKQSQLNNKDNSGTNDI